MNAGQNSCCHLGNTTRATNSHPANRDMIEMTQPLRLDKPTLSDPSVSNKNWRKIGKRDSSIFNSPPTTTKKQFLISELYY